MRRVLLIGIVVALLVGALAAPGLADIRLKGGWFKPTEEPPGELNEATGILFGAELVSSLGETLGIGVGADYFQSHYSVDYVPSLLVNGSYRVIPITGTVYLYPSGGLYLGAGIGYYLANRSTDTGYSDDKSGFGYHATAGYQITDLIFVEGKYSTCKISDWGDFDAGGISIVAGISL